MFIEIDQASAEPIYTQLMKEIKKAIVKGEIQRGEWLPSVRSLAGDLGVNMHTVNKAYNLLVDAEILEKSQRGYQINTTDNIPKGLEEQMQARLEDLFVDIFIHELPKEKVDEWTRDISNHLKREW